MKAIIDTWAPLCDKIAFVVDNSTTPPMPTPVVPNRFKMPKTRAQKDREKSMNKTHYEWEAAPETYRGYEFLRLPMDEPQSEDWRNIWEKSWKMWQHIGKHHLEDAEWFLKIDDDTFFSPINFKGFARYFNPNKKWYLGMTLMHQWRKKNVVFNAGACYALSRGALRALTPIFESDTFLHRNESKRKQSLCMKGQGAAEDLTISVCLHSIGIDPVNTLDREYRERFSLFQEGGHLDLWRDNAPDMWYWREKPLEVKDGTECCSDKMISFHGYKHREAQVSFKYLHEKYNTEEGVDGKVFEIPQPPQPFLHGKLNFTVDEWRNSYESKVKRQLVYANGKEKQCWKCNTTKSLKKTK